MKSIIIAGMLAALSLSVPMNAIGQTAPAASTQELSVLALAEELYPDLFSEGGSLQTTQGYVYRFYRGSGVYVGFKDQRIYLLGGPFGNDVREQGTVSAVLQTLQLTKAANQSRLTPEPVPVLQNLGLESLGSVRIDTRALSEFATFGLKGFYLFGDSLSGGRRNPNFEYSSLQEGTRVVSAIDGIVVFIREQPETNDFEVFLQPKEGSAWTVAYDHLTQLQVQRGAVITAGTVLGQPARQNNGLLRFELQINQDIGSGSNVSTTHFCPTFLLAPAVRDQWLTALQKMMNDWETVSGLELYDSSKHAPLGCHKPTLTVAEAEGRQ